jgi:hypothetical protein
MSVFALANDFPTTFGTLHLFGRGGAGGEVCDAIEKLRETARAAFQFEFPGCEAVIVQVPAPVRCTFTSVTVHFPAAVKLTGNPEYALPLTKKSGSP